MNPLPRALRLADIGPLTTDVRWLWHGYLAAAKVTLLTSQWKSGKTTLLTLLLDRFHAGGSLAGRPVTPAKAVVVSEEPAEPWLERGRRFQLANHHFLCRPFVTRPTADDWLSLLDQLLDLRQKEGVDLAVIDTLASFFPGSDNFARSILDGLTPLYRLTAAGLGVWLLHHPRKGETVSGQAARGSGALTALVDLIIEMDYFRNADDGDRRRLLRAYSRFIDTPAQLAIELNADGTDYVSLGTRGDVEFAGDWAIIRSVLEKAPSKLTRADILRQWPALPPPSESTLWRRLERAVQEGWLRQNAPRNPNTPFRYWLPSREAEWRKDPLQALLLDDEEVLAKMGIFG